MFKKIISMVMSAAIAAACVPAVLADSTAVRSHEETMLPAADASRQYKNNAETTAYDGNSDTLWVRKNGSEVGIAYISFDLSKAKYEVTEDTLDKVVFSYTVAAKYTSAATQLIQGRYTDIYFDIDESNYTLAQENAYLTNMHSQLCTDTNTDRFHMASKPGIKWQRQGNQLSKGATYDVDVTDLVKNSLKAGKNKFTIIIHGNVTSGQDSGQVMIASKENADETKRPKLTISTTEHVATVKTISGSVTDDTRIEGSTASADIYGGDAEIPTKDTMRGAMFKFDVSNMADYNDYLTSVPITFWAKEQLGSNVDIYVLENSELDWSEDTFTRQTLLGSEAYNRGNLNTIGGFGENDIGTITVSGKNYTKYVFEAKNYVQKLILEGKTSFTLLFYGNLNTNQITIASKENDDASLRPTISATVGVTKTLEPEWSIYANTDSVEIPEPAIAPGYVLNVKYKKAAGEGGYTDMESFEKSDLQNGRFIIGGLEKDTEYEFLIVPEYDDEYDVFKAKTVSTAADTSFVMNSDISANEEGTKATARFSWVRGNSAPGSIMLAVASYTSDGVLSDVAFESIDSVQVGAGNKTLSVGTAEDETVKAFAWQQNLAPIN